MKILNLTQHPATQEQLSAGVIEPDNKEQVQSLLTFDKMPTVTVMANRAMSLVIIAEQYMCCSDGCAYVMIGGAPFFMPVLERVLIENFVPVVYSFSQRQAVDIGHGKKMAFFKHVGWVQPDLCFEKAYILPYPKTWKWRQLDKYTHIYTYIGPPIER